MDELLGASQVADLYQVTRQRIHAMLHEGKLPKPDYMKGNEPLWLPATIDKARNERKQHG